jgi:hypothetical protein
MDYCLKQLLKQTVQIAPYVSRNFNNEFTYGTNVSVASRIENDTKVIKNVDGRDVVSSCQIYVDGSTIVNVNSRVTLPDGGTPRIINIQEMPDETGNIYYKCIFT